MFRLYVKHDYLKYLFFLFNDFQLEKHNVSASQTLRSALFKTENTHPGFAYNLVAGIMKQGDISINMNESVLRLQGTVSDLEGKI
jgi:programmed cell death protein 10